MIFKVDDVEIEINKGFYNRTKVQEDGITHIVDTSTSYPYFQFGMGKNYLNVKDKTDMLKQVVADLKKVTREFEQQIERDDKEKGDER